VSVYVDKPAHGYGRMVMCHMLADSPAELHAMAERIGVARRHYQPRSTPHYDICKAMRAKAVAAGAIETDRYGINDCIKRIRANPQPWIDADPHLFGRATSNSSAVDSVTRQV